MGGGKGGKLSKLVLRSGREGGWRRLTANDGDVAFDGGEELCRHEIPGDVWGYEVELEEED